MQILALIGSPRKGGNSDVLVDELLAHSLRNGHAARKVYLYDYDIRPCLDCRRCQKGDHTCALPDAMPELYGLLTSAEVIVFATPVYWYGPTAKMKLLIDRLRPFVASGGLRGKQGVLVVPSEESEQCCGPLVELFGKSLDYLGMTVAGSLLVRAYEKGEVAGKPEDLARAAVLGASLGSA